MYSSDSPSSRSRRSSASDFATPITVVALLTSAFALPFGSLFLTSEIKVTPFQLGFFLIVSPVAQVVADVLGQVLDPVGQHPLPEPQ